MKKKDPIINTLDDLTLPMGLVSAGLGLFVVNKMMEAIDMFSTDEKIPKGVVKEMTEGVVSGIITHFDCKIIELENRIKELERQKELLSDELNDKNDEVFKIMNQKPKIKKKK